MITHPSVARPDISDKSLTICSRHLIKYALTLLGSRAFSSAHTVSYLKTIAGKPLLDVYNPDMLLYPGVDSLNHNPLTQNSWKSDEEGFGIVVNDELTAGMEVWNPYGGKSNGECEFLFLAR